MVGVGGCGCGCGDGMNFSGAHRRDVERDMESSGDGAGVAQRDVSLRVVGVVVGDVRVVVVWYWCEHVEDMPSERFAASGEKVVVGVCCGVICVISGGVLVLIV